MHAYFAGHMAEVSISPDDPLFFFHHAYIDKLFEVWFRKNQANDSKVSGNVYNIIPYFSYKITQHYIIDDTRFN